MFWNAAVMTPIGNPLRSDRACIPFSWFRSSRMYLAEWITCQSSTTEQEDERESFASHLLHSTARGVPCSQHDPPLIFVSLMIGYPWAFCAFISGVSWFFVAVPAHPLEQSGLVFSCRIPIFRQLISRLPTTLPAQPETD